LSSRIPESQISELKNRVDLVEIVGESVLLKKAGRNFVGLCPFHSEKTPSFTVNPDKQIFHCFGCGAGGNVFTFLMKHQGCGFPEAVEKLAVRYGIPLPQKAQGPHRRHDKTERESLLEIHQIAAGFYHRILMESPEGRSATAYLKKRGISDATLRAFQIGYAPKGWDRLTAYLLRQGIRAESAFRSGLIIPKEKGRGYDRFRDRILFPIRDLEGRIIGCGGRVMDAALPKYIISPESSLFVKSRSLYGLDRARKTCRESGSVYLVEGYFDVITLHQHGIENTVAPLGTGLTADHIRLLKGFAGTFYLVFDPDAAGVAAVERIIPALIRENVSARVVALPDGKDPDAFVLERGPEAFSIMADQSLPVMSFLIRCAKTRHGLSSEGKRRIVADLENVLTSIDDGVNRSILIQEVAESIGVQEKALLDRIRDRMKQGVMSSDIRDKGLAHEAADGILHRNPHLRFETKILSMMLEYPVMLPEIRDRGVLDRFTDSDLKAIGTLILSYRGAPEGIIPEVISMANDTETGARIARLASGEESWNRAGCLKLIGQYEAYCDKPEKESLNARIQAAQELNDPALLAALLDEKQRRIHDSD